MDRRNFLQATVVTALAAQGYLPLLGAERKTKPRTRANRVYRGPKNIYTEPSAIEPITGYLPRFKPLAQGSMRKSFSAKYSLIACHGSAAKSKNRVRGSLDVAFSGNTCRTTEMRQANPQNIVTTELTCKGRFNTVSHWTLDSSVQGMSDFHFVEQGRWDGKTMLVKSKSWTQTRSTSHPLIARWALLPLLDPVRDVLRPILHDPGLHESEADLLDQLVPRLATSTAMAAPPPPTARWCRLRPDWIAAVAELPGWESWKRAGGETETDEQETTPGEDQA